MPRGEHTENHTGRLVGRATPRIAQLLANHINEGLDNSYQHFMEQNPMAGYTQVKDQNILVTDSQHALDRYRKARNEGMNVDPEKQHISEAFSMRHEGLW